MEISCRGFGATAAGEAVELFELTAPTGVRARIATLGATLVGLDLPDRRGDVEDVVLGFDGATDYLGPSNQHFGCTTGRVANRIARARYELDGRVRLLDANLGPHQLHGGRAALHTVVWSADASSTDERARVRFTHVSPDGSGGHPGNLTIGVDYVLQRDGMLTIDYTATTDAPTPVNLTNHAYWNLAGHASGSVLDHVLAVHASAYVPTDDDLIPTGAVEPIPEVLDFRQPKRLGQDIGALLATPAGGFDHSLVLDGDLGALREAATLHDPRSGRRLSLRTTEPCVQVYSGNSLFGQGGKQGARYPRHSAVCLEAQRFPDAVNHPAFPSVVLRPGEVYRQTTEHRFTAG